MKFGPLASVVWRKMVWNWKHNILFLLMLIFAGSSWACYRLIQGYQQHFVEQLQHVYPEHFVRSSGLDLSRVEALTGVPEVFELNFRLRCRQEYDGPTREVLGVGLRATDEGREDEKGLVFWVNQSMLTQLNARDDKPVQLFVDGHGEWLPVSIKPIEIPGKKPWIVVSMKTAEQLGMKKGILRIVLSEGLSKARYQQLKKEYGLIHWREVIPFNSRLFYFLTTNTGAILSLGVLVLIVLLGVSFLQDLFADFSRYIKICYFYGQSFGQLWFQFQVLVFGYSILLGLLAFWGGHVICHFIAGIFPTLEQVLSHSVQLPPPKFFILMPLIFLVVTPLFVHQNLKGRDGHVET